jgi:hypothetical protein
VIDLRQRGIAVGTERHHNAGDVICCICVVDPRAQTGLVLDASFNYLGIVRYEGRIGPDAQTEYVWIDVDP